MTLKRQTIGKNTLTGCVVSEGTNAELALRDLAIEIEKLQIERDEWRSIAKRFYDNRNSLNADELRWAAEAYERQSDEL